MYERVCLRVRPSGWNSRVSDVGEIGLPNSTDLPTSGFRVWTLMGRLGNNTSVFSSEDVVSPPAGSSALPNTSPFILRHENILLNSASTDRCLWLAILRKRHFGTLANMMPDLMIEPHKTRTLTPPTQSNALRIWICGEDASTRTLMSAMEKS